MELHPFERGEGVELASLGLRIDADILFVRVDDGSQSAAAESAVQGES